jgi:hypothetical protein
MSGRFAFFINKARKKDRVLLFFAAKRAFCTGQKLL